VQAFHLALGQFLNYRVNLQLQEPERQLWLAVTSDTFDSFFHTELVTRSVTHYQVPILVFNPLTEVIELWQAT
jgi:XisH protein